MQQLLEVQEQYDLPVGQDAFCWSNCFWPTNNIPAPIPPTSTTNPNMVAIIFPPPNFFFGLETTEETSGGAAEPVSPLTG
jgi:hypothetical protein